MARLSTILVEGFRFACAAEQWLDEMLSRSGIRRRYFSQKGQDRWVIERALEGCKGGYFVEVGAGDGRTHSNTFVLERDHGWTGLLIEPNPAYARSLRKFRTSTHLELCVDRELRDGDFLALGYMGGLIADDTDYAPARRASVLRRHADKIIRVACRPLADILKDAGAPAVIDFLSIDVEGAEHRLLQDFPFERYDFRAVTVERPTPEVHDLLSRAGYVLDRLHFSDGFYLSNDTARRLGVDGLSFSGTPRKFF